MQADVQALKKDLEMRGVRGIALDIDETLADTNRHWFDLLMKAFPLEDQSIEGLMRRHKFTEHVPGWNHSEALAYMNTLMHSEEVNENVPIIEDANHIVRKIHEIIPVVAYITARPETVRTATLRWLTYHDFPEAPLVMRESEAFVSVEDVQNRNGWKANVLAYLHPEIVGIIDDNAGLAHGLAAIAYPGVLYLYGDQSATGTHPGRTIPCPTWENVLSAVVG